MTKLKRVTDITDAKISLTRRKEALKLFNENQNLMFYLINMWIKKYMVEKTEDLIQDCSILFWKCCIHHDSKKGKLSTFYSTRLKSYFHYYFVLHNNCIKRKINNNLGSLDKVYETSTGPQTILDSITDENNYEDISDAYLSLLNIINCIDEREKKMVLLRANGYSLREIGDMYGISKERVRQIIDKAYIKLKEKINSK